MLDSMLDDLLGARHGKLVRSAGDLAIYLQDAIELRAGRSIVGFAGGPGTARQRFCQRERVVQRARELRCVGVTAEVEIHSRAATRR